MGQAERSQRAGRTHRQRLTSLAAVLGPLLLFASLLSTTWACTPTVTVAAPKEPIEINLNIKIGYLKQNPEVSLSKNSGI